MSQPTTVSVKIGSGVFGALFLVLLVLKLTGLLPVAAWSWWWVTAPLWGPWVLGLVLVLLALAWALLMTWLRSSFRR